jgi:CBS domain-containing protein
MNVLDIMTTDPLTVAPDTPLKEAARLMVAERISGLPVVEGGALVGIVTEGDFLRQEAGRQSPTRYSLLDALFGDSTAGEPGAETVSEVMTDKVISITPDASLGEAARTMANKSVNRLPVVDGDGRLVGIISRADVVNAFTKPDEVIQDEVEQDVIRRILFLDPSTVEVNVDDGVVHLAGEVENRTEAELLEELVRRIAGVVKVHSELTFEVDDRKVRPRGPLG